MAAVVNIGDWVIASANKVWTPEELACAEQAVGLMEQAAERARQIIAQAEVDGERLRAAAQSEGYRSGEVQALRRVLGRLGGQETLVKAVRSFVTEAISSCTESILVTELDPSRYRRLLETVEQTLSGWTWLKMRVAPVCIEEAAAVVASMQSSVTDRVTLVPDDTLRVGECVIESDSGWLDGRIETQLEQVRVALAEMLDVAEHLRRES